MSTEIERARRAEPPWDEVRERRVLARVGAEREARRSASVRTRRMLVLSTAAAACVLAGVGGAQWLGLFDDAPAERTASVPAAAPVAERDPGLLSLTDGSEIELGEGARVEITSESATDVQIHQREGAARYVVSHLPSRRFVVTCDDVEVEVRGTRFWVRREADAVEVEVEEGRVEVRRGTESSLLGRGESLRVRTVDPVAERAPVEVVAPEIAVSPSPSPRRERAVASGASSEAGAAATPAATATALLNRAEELRRDGRLDEAVGALNEAVSLLGTDRRAATAYFTLGRLERTRSRHAAAAAAFEAAYERDPDAILAEDALAEAAVSWSVAGNDTRARAAGTRYLTRYPDGEYLPRVRAAIGD